MDPDFIKDLLDQKFLEEEFKDCFLIDVEYSKISNKLQVFIDSDSGFGFDKCRRISGYLEAIFDEQGTLGEKYTLEISSPGLSRPLKLRRQYINNCGRNVRISLVDGGKVEGKIKAIENDMITIEQKNGWRKINCESIKTAKVVPSFK